VTEQQDKLYAALVKFQHTVRPAQKNAAVSHLKNRYANLESVFEAIREPMGACGLCITQLPSMADGQVGLTTRVAHASGQYIEQTMSVPVPDMKIQTIGSALTYLRRYMASAMLGVVTGEDDDGEVVQRATPTTAPGPTEADKPTLECLANAKTKQQLSELYAGLNEQERNRLTPSFTARKNELGIK
jgi:hypothetical protein